MASAPKKQLILPAVMDLDAIDEVRESLLAAIERGPVTVSAVAVERVATNAVLMLVSAGETARRNDFPLTIVGASGAMQAAIARLGLEPAFSGMMEG